MPDEQANTKLGTKNQRIADIRPACPGLSARTIGAEGRTPVQRSTCDLKSERHRHINRGNIMPLQALLERRVRLAAGDRVAKQFVLGAPWFAKTFSAAGESDVRPWPN